LRNGNEYFPKPCGAEVGVFRRLQAHGYQLDIYLFSAQLMGGGVLLWLLYWRNAFTPTALPERCLMGWTRRSMKNRPLEMRWKRALVD